jgi:tRNA nucleotidyltransferase (CCA-adding enzyme)
VAALPSGSALVGGAVRDGLLNRLGPHPDLDIVVPAGAIHLARELARAHGGVAVVLDQERDMARVVQGPSTIDLAACIGINLEADLGRRDYRINAMALPLCGIKPLIDPMGGLEELRQKLVSAISEENLQSDPLRLLRGPRLAAELNFTLEPRTSELLRKHAALLSLVSAERVLAELEKLASCRHGAKGLASAQKLGLLNPWLEPLAIDKTLLDIETQADIQAFNAAEISNALPLALLAQLFSAEGLRRLRASRKLQQRCEKLRYWYQILYQSPGLAEEEQLQLCRDLETDLTALIVLAPNQTRGWLKRWRNPDDGLFHPRSPIDGAELQQQLGLKPGPALGQVLWELTKARAFGRPHNLEAARFFAKQNSPPHD